MFSQVFVHGERGTHPSRPSPRSGGQGTCPILPLPFPFPNHIGMQPAKSFPLSSLWPDTQGTPSHPPEGPEEGPVRKMPLHPLGCSWIISKCGMIRKGMGGIEMGAMWSVWLVILMRGLSCNYTALMSSSRGNPGSAPVVDPIRSGQERSIRDFW